VVRGRKALADRRDGHGLARGPAHPVRRALAEAFNEADKPAEREHVTPFIYTRPERYRLKAVTGDRDYSNYRWTVDTPEDFTLIQKIITCIYPINPHFTMQDCLQAYRLHPGWLEINSHIEQKKLSTEES